MDKEFEASLKSIETENTIDLYFYRPIGFRIARALRNTGITPNMITIFSIFVGVGTGIMFYFDNMLCSLIGVLLLVFANILDCVDGQLARITGIKSEFGRILDGVAGNVWFLTIYVCLALRLTNMYHTAWFFLPAFISGISHLLQANVTDYYKTLHLFFVSPEKGYEFRNIEQVKRKQKTVKNGLEKFFFSLYEAYTSLQENMTPSLQLFLSEIYTIYGNDIPANIRMNFRQKSQRLMKWCIDFLTFNGRTIVLFIVVLLGEVWIYFIYEAVILNIILYIGIRKHEKMCSELRKSLVE